MLGLPVGAFEPGSYADAVALDLDDLSLYPLETLERQVVNSMQSTAIARVIVGGRVVIDGGRLTTFDASEIRNRIAAVSAKWARPV
jgi:cytosine/adenosine deaminase-related metal-dependent hydrolase